MQNWPVVKEKDIKQSQEFQYPLYWNWNMKAKSLKKLLVITEICSWLPLGLDGRKVWSQILLKSLKLRPRYGDFSIFKNGGRRHVGFLKLQISNCGTHRKC